MDIRLQMLVEYLTSESGGEEEQASSSKVSRLIIAGNTFALPSEAKAAPTDASTEKKSVSWSGLVDWSLSNSPHLEKIRSRLLDIQPSPHQHNKRPPPRHRHMPPHPSPRWCLRSLRHPPPTAAPPARNVRQCQVLPLLHHRDQPRMAGPRFEDAVRQFRTTAGRYVQIRPDAASNTSPTRGGESTVETCCANCARYAVVLSLPPGRPVLNERVARYVCCGESA